LATDWVSYCAPRLRRGKDPATTGGVGLSPTCLPTPDTLCYTKGSRGGGEVNSNEPNQRGDPVMKRAESFQLLFITGGKSPPHSSPLVLQEGGMEEGSPPPFSPLVYKGLGKGGVVFSDSLTQVPSESLG
jgi:hypothetical protein